MAYIVKWIPRDLELPIDHAIHYARPEDAMEFACRILGLSPKTPKKIWIEESEGSIYAEYPQVLEFYRGRKWRSPAKRTARKLA
jgi:hypothetical protein